MTKLERQSGWAGLALAAVLASGCNKTASTVDDPTLTANVQGKIAADGALASEPIQVLAQAGTVTLTGGVSNAAARSLAARDAAGVAGVKEVVNDITVNAATAPASAVATTRLPQPKVEPVGPSRAKVVPPPPPAAPVTRVPPTPQGAIGPPTPRPAGPPPPPPAPAVRTVTLPAGSSLPVRVTQTLDSATAQVGDTFSGAVAADIVQDGMVMIPRGAPVSGRVTEVHEAAHFKGAALLTVELTGLTSRGDRVPVATQPYTVQGKGRGENTAVKTGVGAAAGAILGGIFGGGKGAAIGAAAGGGTGAGINAVTRGQQVTIPSETVVRFATTASITTRTSVHAGEGGGDGGLRDR